MIKRVDPDADRPAEELELPEVPASSHTGSLSDLDELCDQYEQRRRSGEPADIEEFLRQVPESSREELRAYLLDAEAALRDQESFPAQGMAGRYRFVSKLGEGAYGRVFLAFDNTLDRLVTIKVPRTPTPEAARRLTEEARKLTGLEHSGIPRVLDVVRQSECEAWIVTTYVEGTTLAERLKRRLDASADPADEADPAFTLDKAVHISSQLAETLAHAHARGLIHRDVKPANVLLDPGGRVLLLDFGLATWSGAGRVGEIAGTDRYMAPEARSGSCLPDPRADVYSLGVVLKEMLAAVPGAVSAMAQRLQTICDRATAPLPADRYQSISEFTAALETCPTGSGPHPPPRKPSRVVQVVGVATALAMVLAIGWNWSAGRGADASSLAQKTRQANVAGGGVTPSAPGPGSKPPATDSPQPQMRTVVVKVSDSQGQVGFTRLKGPLREWNSTRWTTSEKSIELAPGDYLVTAISGSRFVEVYRRVPVLSTQKPRFGYPHMRSKIESDQRVTLPKIDVSRGSLMGQEVQLAAAQRGQPEPMALWHLQTPAFPALDLYVDAAPTTVGEYVAVIKELPVTLRRLPGITPDMPLTRISYDEAAFFAESAGKRVPDLDEFHAIQQAVEQQQNVLKNTGSFAAFWTATETDSVDPLGFPLIRLWARRADLPVPPVVSRSAHPEQVGLRFVRSAAPRAPLPGR